MSKKDEDKKLGGATPEEQALERARMSPTTLPPEDVKKGAGGVPRVEDAKAPKPDPETDAQLRDVLAAEKRHTAVGGPFAVARVDPTETEAALAARGYGPAVAKRSDVRGAEKGFKLYRTTRPMYRQGLYVEADTVIAVPEGEQPSRTWVEADQKNDLPVFVLPPNPTPSEADLKAAEQNRQRQLAQANAATALAALNLGGR